jgi:hypothetical protein
MNIFAARFIGHKPGGIVNQSYRTFCYGIDEATAEAELRERYEKVARLQLQLCPIITVGDCMPGDRIYRVEDRKLIGDVDPHRSYYWVCEPCEIIGHVTCKVIDGTKVRVAPSLQCIVRPEGF